GVLMVHSAFKGLAREGWHAEATLAALMAHMAPGTLSLPTMSWRFVKPAQPVFDAGATPSNTGFLTELFRREHASHRSSHPTHSAAAVGSLAAWLTDGHHLDDTPCSGRSPFGRLAEADGWVLLLGISMDCCTLIHHAEEVVAPGLYLRPPDQAESYTCRAMDGAEYRVRLRRHLFLRRDYWQFQDGLAAAGALRVGLLDGIPWRLFRARALTELALAALRRQPDVILARPAGRYRLM
ncbi:MAG: AAC(3) family N-acetyltransferase, partial [Rhodospirillales bacterium]|nr:AAC(3) family N-acetyltransferase [Rhodospirillales bacterium]